MWPSLEDVRRVQSAGLYTDGAHKGAGPAGVSLPPGKLADLVLGQMPYLLEIHRGGRLEASLCLPMVQEIRQMRPGGMEMSWTLGSVVREFSLHRALEVELRGHSGRRHRAGHNRHGQFTYADGPALLRELDAFLDRYRRLAVEAQHDLEHNPDAFTALQASFGETFLVLRAFRERLHLKVEPVGGFEVMADERRHRTTYGWRLRLRAYEPAQPAAPRNVLGVVADAALVVAGGIDALNTYLALVERLAAGLRADLEVLREPLRALRRAGALVGEVAGRAGDLLQFPRDLFGDAVAAMEQLVDGARAFGALDERFTGASGPPGRTAQRAALFTQGEQALLPMVAAAGALRADRVTLSDARARVRSGHTGPAFRPQETAGQPAGQQADFVGFFEVRAGQDLLSIAGLVLGDVGRWGEVAALNGNPDPWTLRDGRPIEAGALLRVPRTSPVPFGAADPQGALGVDLLIDPRTGDLVPDATGRDVRLVRGDALLSQALRHRLLTVQGQGLLPSYGLPALLGQPSGQEQLVYWSAVVAEQLAADVRVGAVLELAVEDTGDGAAVRAVVEPVVGAALDVLAPGPGGVL